MITDLYNVIESHVENLESQLFTALPCTILSFDPETQTASVQPVMLEPYTDGVVSKFPKIDFVPVVFPSAGGGSLTFPVKTGDEVLVIFSARNFDVWWDSGEVDKISSSQRYHNITDAIAIVGLTSKPNSVKASTEDVELKFNSNTVRLKADGNVEIDCSNGMKISNNSEELVSLISQLADEVSKITTNTVFGATPINNQAAVAAIKSKIDSFVS